MYLEFEKLRFDRESDCSREEGGKANQAGGACVVFEGAMSPDLLFFIVEKDNLDSYLL